MTAQRDADALLRGLGTHVGIPDLAFDADGYCCMSFDDHVVNLEYDDKRDDILVYAQVGDVPAHPPSSFHPQVLEANYTSALLGLGTLGVDNEKARVVWFDRIVPRAMTQQAFQDALRIAIDRVEFWKKSLASQKFQRGETTTEALYIEHMIRA